uniref:Uncharacterized protein n=1 Tax=Oryza barthii TaxID=65489 RepID=A0A0D3G4X8_9ORYZ
MAVASLESSVEATLDALRGDQWRARQPFTIFRVPANVRESNRTSYEPRVVSIGPYYHGGAALRTIEDHKWHYLQGLLSRHAGDGSVAAVSASTLVAEIRTLEARARACYSERPAGLASDDFILMLLLDGCFILEFLLKWHAKEPDALCDAGRGLTLVPAAADLLLMENQIPFFVLERLYGAVTGGGAQHDRESLLHLFVKYLGSEDEEPMRWPSGDWEVHHLLHLYYQSFIPNRTPPRSRRGPRSDRRTITRTPRVIPCATEMREAGVQFVAARSPAAAAGGTRYDVAFDARWGVMEIPTVLIDDARRPLLANLLAFEQSQRGEEEGLLSSYVALMSHLIVTARDVELLRRRGVVVNLLDNDEEAARFFNRLDDCHPAGYDSQAFSGLYDDVTRYCGTWWHSHMAGLRRNYFPSPWSAISVAVATFGKKNEYRNRYIIEISSQRFANFIYN